MKYNVVFTTQYNNVPQKPVQFTDIKDAITYLTGAIDFVDDGNYYASIVEVNPNPIETGSIFTINPYVQVFFNKKQNFYFNIDFIIADDNDSSIFITDEGDTISIAQLNINLFQRDNKWYKRVYIKEDVISVSFVEEINKMFNYFSEKYGVEK